MKAFAANAVTNPKSKARRYFGVPENLDQLSQVSKQDLTGFRRILTSDEVRKNLNKHGGDSNPLRVSDFKRLNSVLRKPDRVIRGGLSRRRKLQTIISYKKIGDASYRVTEEIQPKRKYISVLSFLKE